MLLLLVLLPLQWFVVLGPFRLHIFAMMCFLALVVVTHGLDAFLPVIRLTGVFVVANAALCAIWMAANALHGIGLRQPVQQLIYLGVFLAVGTVMYRGILATRSRMVETLRWSALVVSLSLLLALSISMARNGVNAAEVFGRTIAAADPEILQRELFRTAFVGFGFDEAVVRGNLRHEVFGAVLVAMTVSAACVGLRPLASAVQRGLYLFSMVLGSALILVSMSRSIMIAAAVWPLLIGIRVVLTARMSGRLLGGTLLAAVTTIALAFGGALTVLWVRFTQDTGSYEARDNLLQQAFENIVSNAVTGGVATGGASSHNFVLDTWLRAGVFAALAAAVVVMVLLALFLSLTSRLSREPVWMLPVTAMFVMPLVRMFTAGGGLIPPVSWVGLGFAAGFMMYRKILNESADHERAASRVEDLRQ